MGRNGPKITLDLQKIRPIYCTFMAFWLNFNPFFWSLLVTILGTGALLCGRLKKDADHSGGNAPLVLGIE